MNKQQLTKEEQAMVKALRRLRVAEAKPAKVPAALLEHGYVNLRRAAELLSVAPAEIERLTKKSPAREQLPTVGAPLKTGGLIPISELLRQFKMRHFAQLAELAQAVVDQVKTAGVHGWSAHAGFSFPWRYYSVDDTPRGHSRAEVAKELGISKAAVDRLAADDDGLFVWGRRHGDFTVTVEELQAYQRKLADLPSGRPAWRSRAAA